MIVTLLQEDQEEREGKKKRNELLSSIVSSSSFPPSPLLLPSCYTPKQRELELTCSNKFLGTKVTTVYLDVMDWLVA